MIMKLLLLMILLLLMVINIMIMMKILICSSLSVPPGIDAVAIVTIDADVDNIETEIML